MNRRTSLRHGAHFLMALAVLAHAAPVVAATIKAEIAPAIRLQRASVLLTVGPDGAPGALRCGPTVVEAVCPVLTKAIGSWTFAPGTRDGQPVAMDVHLLLELAAVPKANGFGIQSTGAVLGLAHPQAGAMFDGPVPKHRMPPPQYPPDDMRRGRTGTVVLELWADPGARTYRVGRTWLDGKAATGKESFVKAAVKAASQWPVEPMAPEQRSVCTDIAFTLATKSQGAAPSPEFKDCTPTYADGVVLPRLLTDPVTASF